MTAFLTSTAYARAAPSARSSSADVTGTHATDEMLITDAPRSAAVRMAFAMVSTSPTPVLDRSLAGANFALDWRMLIKVASGATPPKPSALESGAAEIIPATRVPCASQSWVPSPVET
jgi:hypothetical protein